MKVIDLLNKIANGEIPKKIMIENMLYTHDGIDYKRESDREYLFDVFLETTTEDFNREVEIIEEDKKIEEIDVLQKILSEDKIEALTMEVSDIENKLNEIIDVLNEMREDK